MGISDCVKAVCKNLNDTINGSVVYDEYADDIRIWVDANQKWTFSINIRPIIILHTNGESVEYICEYVKQRLEQGWVSLLYR